MESSPLIFRYGFDPYKANRQNRKVLKKELDQTKRLRALINTFADAIQLPNVDYEEVFDMYNAEWKRECSRLNNHQFKAFYANKEHFSDLFGFEKGRVKTYKEGISIIKNLTKLVWK